MTPEEKFNQEIWWILQEIRKEQLSTPAGEKIEFSVQLTKKKETDIPSPESQRKLLHKLQEWQALKSLEVADPFYINDFSSPPTKYRLVIAKPKFDKLYSLYENGGSYLENQKTIPEAKISQSVIKPKSLELIAREIGNLETGTNLIDFLTDCGVDKKLIEYPQTKWRMVYSVLLTLASSKNKDDKRTLFQIIEGACHPLMYSGDKNLAQKTVDKFNSFLEYDNFCVKDGVLWEGWENGADVMRWGDKDGNTIEPACYVIFPQIMDKLYVYWNELIKLTEFYLSNKDSQDDEIDDEINDIYFEIIANVEKLLDGDGCGKLKESYKRPFRNIIGCEFEIQKQNLTPNDLFVNLYDFFGKITELWLPDKNNVEKIKKENSAFFIKIKQYYKQHLTKKESTIQEPPATKIEIVGGKGIEGLQDGLKAIAQTKKEDKNKFPYKLPAEFLITVNDREIRINNYLIAKPHAVGSNYDFFEYIRSQPANKPIERKDLNDDLRRDLGNKNSFKMLNALGFKGRIKQAFFCKVDANTLCYRGDKITLQQLEETGINVKLFIKELELADAKYNPD